LLEESFGIQFRILFRPELENPLLVCGLPGIGNVGKIAASLLIEFSRAKLFAELYSHSFPDYVLINEKGLCRPPRCEFYVSTVGKRNLIILTGDAQPSMEDIPAHYELCGKILDFTADYGCRFIITIGGAPGPQVEREIYVAATSQKIAAEFMEKGAIIYGGGRIIGASGLLLGLAKKRGLEGICLLGTTPGLASDRESARYVYKFLMKSLEAEIKEDL